MARLPHPPARFQLYLLLGIAIAGTIVTQHASGQALPDSIDLEAFIEPFEADQEIDEDLQQSIAELLANPIDLNKGTRADFLQIPLMNPILAGAIISWRTQHGPFERIEDVMQIPGVDESIFKAFRPFVYLQRGPAKSFRPPLSFSLTLNYRQRLDLTRGFLLDQNGYEGMPATRYARLRFRRPNSFTAQLVVENDAGERFFWKPARRAYGFDHLSGFFSIEDKRLIRQLLVGDFVIEAGQGLVFWRPFGRGKGVQPTSDPLRRAGGVRPSASREEQAFFRGFAIGLQPLRRLHLTLFASQRTLDASLMADTVGDKSLITALVSGGLHRTPAERSRRDNLRSRLYGVIAGLDLGRLRLETIGYETRFEYAFAKDIQPADRYDFSGRRLSGFGVNASLSFDRVFLWGETAASRPGGRAAIAGVLIQPTTALESILIWRHYSPSYQSFYANGFAESRSFARNESGFYAGMEWVAGASWKVGFFYDLYEHIWLRHNLSSPARGSEIFMRVTYQPRSWLNAYIQFRTEKKASNTRVFDKTGRLLKSTSLASHSNVRVQLDYRFSAKLAVRTRIETKLFRSDFSKNGILAYQDVIWSPINAFRLRIRMAVFDAPDRDAAVYAYEHDVLYQSRIASFTGAGVRNFILFRYRISAQMSLELKYSSTQYDAVMERGSGLDAFSGHRIRELNAQCIVRL